MLFEDTLCVKYVAVILTVSILILISLSQCLVISTNILREGCYITQIISQTKREVDKESSLNRKSSSWLGRFI